MYINDMKFSICFSFLFLIRLNFFSSANTFSIKYRFFNFVLLYLLLLFFIFLRLGTIVLTIYYHVKTPFGSSHKHDILILEEHKTCQSHKKGLIKYIYIFIYIQNNYF